MKMRNQLIGHSHLQGVFSSLGSQIGRECLVHWALTFAGNIWAASTTAPEYSLSGSSSLERSSFCSTTNGAFCKPAGGLWVAIVILCTLPPSATAFTASRPASAPVGTMIRPPLFAAPSYHIYHAQLSYQFSKQFRKAFSVRVSLGYSIRQPEKVIRGR